VGESALHTTLVEAIVQWIGVHTDVPMRMAVLVSSPSTSPLACPPSIDGCIPDVYCRCPTAGVVVLGEAKTSKDIETQHSRRQFAVYLRHLATFERATLVAAVPWFCVNQTRGLLKRIQQVTDTTHVSIVVLDQLPAG